MKELTGNEILKKLDRMNKEGFKFMMIRYSITGLREETERQKNFLKSLKTKPIETIKLKNSPRPDLDKIREFAFVINLDNFYINIYPVTEEIKKKFPGISKEHCGVMFE